MPVVVHEGERGTKSRVRDKIIGFGSLTFETCYVSIASGDTPLCHLIRNVLISVYGATVQYIDCVYFLSISTFYFSKPKVLLVPHSPDQPDSAQHID